MSFQIFANCFLDLFALFRLHFMMLSFNEGFCVFLGLFNISWRSFIESPGDALGPQPEEVVRLLLKAGVDVNQRSRLAERRNDEPG